MGHTVVIHSPGEGHLCCSWALAVVTGAAVSVGLPSVWTRVPALSGSPRGGTVGLGADFGRAAEAALLPFLNDFLLCDIFPFGFKLLLFS